MNIGRGLQVIWARVVRGDREAGYELARVVSGVLAPSYRFAEPGRTWMDDREFLDEYTALTGGGLMEMADKKLVVRNLGRWVRSIPGDIAECGSYRGVSARFLADATHGTGKQLHLFDSFEGISPPTGRDGSHWRAGDLRAGENECRRALGPHVDRATLHPGWIPERFVDVDSGRFCLVHVDVDLYEPHVDSIVFFWPRLALGGVMLFDDYGSEYCPGARQAIDEAFDPEDVVELPTGQAFVVKRR